MNDRAKLLKVSAIIASSINIACLMFVVTLNICDKDGDTIYPYILWFISNIPCTYLWKMYIDEKKHNINNN